MDKSALAGRTIVSGALPLHDLSDRRAAYAARLARAIIDEIVELEVAAFTVAADKIAQRAAALLDRSGERDAHRVGQQFVAHERDASRRCGRPDAGAKQTLRGVDIPHA